jgi:hypothetical protein
MDLTAARKLAEAKLREIEAPDTPLRLFTDPPGIEIGWAWCFPFNSVSYLETGDFRDMVFSGPVVVTKDGADVWVAASAPPLEQWLNAYAEQHGYPPVPMPEHPGPTSPAGNASPFA